MGNTITWTIIKGYEVGTLYYIYRHSNLVQSDTWDTSSLTIVNVDGLSEGLHIYRIVVQNTLEAVEDTVTITVQQEEEPEPEPEPELEPEFIPGFPVVLLGPQIFIKLP